MKYLILVRGGAFDATLAADMTEAGVRVAAEGLAGPELARGTVGHPPVTAFYLVDCDSPREAAAWAARTIDYEVRPVLEHRGEEF